VRWNVERYQETVFRRLGLELHGTERVLDLGCGDGADADWFARHARETIGVDLEAHPRWDQLSRAGLSFQPGDGQLLQFPSGRFDLVFMKDVLHHAADPSQVLREARRVAAPGARIVIVEGNRVNPIFYLHMTLMLGHQHFRRPRFQRLVRETFPQARFIHFEAHVYPCRSGWALRALSALELAIASTPGIERLASYNAAIARV